MSISSRIEATVERWSAVWGKRLSNWASSFVGFGINVFMEILGKSASRQMQSFIKTIEDIGEVPPELKPILDEMKSPTGQSAAIWSFIAGNSIVSGALSRITNNILGPFSYQVASKHPNEIMTVDQMLRLYFRGWYDPLKGGPDGLAKLEANLRLHGYDSQQMINLLELMKVRFPSDIVAPIWLRDKKKYEKYWDDVRSLGITEDRLDILKELAYHMPSVRDVVGFLAHEVFEPKMIAKYGLDDEWGELDKTMFEKVGLKEDLALNYWRDHWQHASWSQVTEMLHRGVISEQDVFDWFRLVEIPPYWRKGLTSIMYNLPGRIEVRMMAQLGLVDKKFVMDILRKDGLAEEYLEVVADMNIVRGVRTDIQARYVKGWLDSDGVRTELEKSGLSPGIVDRLYQWIVSNTKPDRTAAQKDLTKAEIIKAVKQGFVTWEAGVLELKHLGYDEDESNLLLATNIEAVTEPTTTLTTVRVDTIRRQRRAGLMDHNQEVMAFLQVGVDQALAQAYADNDDVRLLPKGGDTTV